MYGDNLDVRFILKPSDNGKIIRTSYPVEVILYDKGFDEDIALLKKSVLTLSTQHNLQDIGKYFFIVVIMPYKL